MSPGLGGAGGPAAGPHSPGPGAEPETRPGRKREEVDAPRGHVLPHLSGCDIEPGRAELAVELGMDEVHLPEVRLRGVAAHAGPVLDRLARVCVAFDAEACDQRDHISERLGHRVRVAPGDGHDDARHAATGSDAAALSKTSSPSRASTLTVSPSAYSRSRSRIASGFSTRRWIARLSGRAP